MGDTTFEMCPYCEHEVEISAELKVQKCPKCGKWLAPCSMCDQTSCKDCALEREAHRRNDRPTLREYLKVLRAMQIEFDIQVDGVDTVAYCATGLTLLGEEKFKSALDLPVEGNCVVSDDPEDYRLLDEEKGNLQLAWNMLYGMSGYMLTSEWEKLYFV